MLLIITSMKKMY